MKFRSLRIHLLCLLYAPQDLVECMGTLFEQPHTFSVLGPVLTLEGQGWANLYSSGGPGW